MNMYLITISVNPSTKNSIINRIKNRWGWARISTDAWCIKTNNNIREIRDELSVELSESERIFVVDIKDSSWSSSNLPKEVTDWLKE